MFRSILVEETLRIDPNLLAHTDYDALVHAAKQRFAGRVIPPLGVCITALDARPPSKNQPAPILNVPISDPTGGIRSRAIVELVLWTPIVGEILTAQVRSCTRRGVRVSIYNGFDFCFIPPGHLHEPCTFNDEERCWTWHYDHSDFEIHECDWVRVLVARVAFRGDVSRDGQGEHQWTGATSHGGVAILPPPVPIRPAGKDREAMRSSTMTARKILSAPDEQLLWEADVLPMRVWCRMDASGLGLLEWWNRSEGQG